MNGFLQQSFLFPEATFLLSLHRDKDRHLFISQKDK